MADRSSKTPKREGTILSSSSSSAKRSDNRDKSRSPIVTRSRSRGIDDIESAGSSAITRRAKRYNNVEAKHRESKRVKVVPELQPNYSSESRKQLHVKVRKVSQPVDPRLPRGGTARSNNNNQDNLQKEPEDKKTGSSIGTRKKADLEGSKSKATSSKHLKKLTSSEGESSSVPTSTGQVMDQNGTNTSANTSNQASSSTDGPTNTTTTAATTTSCGPSSSSASGTAAPTVNELATAAAASSLLSSFPLDMDGDEGDMSRLQTILESRGLPPHLLGIPRMQNLFYRSLNNTSNTKAQQILQSLNATNDETEKLHCVLEMCQLLLMGNEDTLVGFPIKTVVPAMINLLSIENNFEIAHHACRALTYMMEALPRSSVVVLDAVPVFLEKLQAIQCMDIAEQSLSALEMLSRRHNKAILHARGVSACLTYVDFFSIDAQRSALTVTANCFQNVTTDDFQYVQDSLPILSSHLTIDDKKCIESICLAFSRLVDCYQHDCAIISEIASHELLTNIQTVLMTVPPVLSTGSFVNTIRMLSIMCSSCSQIAVELLKLNICETLKCLLLCNNSLMESSESINLISRSPQEIYELTCLIAELMPSLPADGIFSVDPLFTYRTAQTNVEQAIWQWKDDRGLWIPFTQMDNKIIESAHHSGEDELELSNSNRSYIIDFNAMQKIYEDTGNSYAIQRKMNNNLASDLGSRSGVHNTDPRSEFIFKEQELAHSFLSFIFTVLNEVYHNSAGYSVRYKCLNAILRILYYTPKELLYLILQDQTLSSSIATMLASTDIRVVVCATQMCHILMEKMPEVFNIFFQREGVIHQIRKLYSDENRSFLGDKVNLECVNNQDSKSSIASSSHSSAIVFSNSIMLDNAQIFLSRNGVTADSYPPYEYISSMAHVANMSKASNNVRPNSSTDQATGNEENSKRKRTRTRQTAQRSATSQHNAASSLSSESNLNLTQAELSLSQSYVNYPIFVTEQTTNSASQQASITNNNNNTSSSSSGTTSGKSGSKLATKDFFQRFNPSRWTRWNQNPGTGGSSSSTTLSNTVTTSANTLLPSTIPARDLVSKTREKIGQWINEHAKMFDEKYFLNSGERDKELGKPSMLKKLSESLVGSNEKVIEALIGIKEILLDNDLSSFELIHSGLVKNLLLFLTSSDHSQENCEQNLRIFMHVFYGVPLSNVIIENLNQLSLDPKPLSILVNKLNACVSQLEQFPLRVNDYSSQGRGTQALKSFYSQFLKVSFARHHSCNNLKTYKGPALRLDPFTTVQSIERYLVNRGYAKIIKEGEDDPDEDEDLSDEDLLDNIAINNSSQPPTGRHRLQILVGDNVLPYNIPLYQGIKNSLGPEHSHEGESETDSQVLNSKFWASTFFVCYRLASDTTNPSNSISSAASTCSNSSSSSNRSSAVRKSNKVSSKKKDELWHEGKAPKTQSPLEPYLRTELTLAVTITDQSLEVLSLLRVLYGINRHWGYLFRLPYSYNPAIPVKEFVNVKLTVKANRQMQDLFAILNNSLPLWLSQICYECPFMFPFDTRYLLFFICSFDRERYMQRLLESSPDFASDPRERFMPRLEKKKRIVSRTDILKSAESLFNDLSKNVGNCKSLLEVQYENEVGTGLGPTLEFYALVSKELQRADLEMWRGKPQDKCATGDSVEFVFSNNGLFPSPIPRNLKASVLNKLKQRFRLLGKFMAKALMDSRMIDIPLNIVFYKWLLNQQNTLTFADFHQLDPALSMMALYKIVHRKTTMNLSDNDELLKLDGCSIADLCLDFTLPGYSNIEMRKLGRDISVNITNLDSYIKLVCHWTMVEGVSKQLEAFKEGFDSVFSSSQLRMFYPEELQQLFCGANYKSWDVKMLMESCKTDHGFTHDSRAIRYLFEILSSYNAEEQRKFLQFLTGSPRLPIGGFKSLIPPFTIVRKSTNLESDNPNSLPSVMTCVNYLKLPDYPTIEMMRHKLEVAINEGQFSFHLS